MNENVYICTMNKNIPSFLYRKNNLVFQVVFTAVFALLFINIYQPFSSQYWYPVTKFEYFAFSSLIILTGMLVVIISRLIMYRYTRKRNLTYIQYALWILAEIFFMSLFYAIYSFIVKDGGDVWEIAKASLVNTCLVILLPYTISILYFSLQEKSKKLRELEEAEAGEERVDKQETISFFDDKGSMVLSIKRSNLLYIEAADNYLIVWFVGNKGNERYMVRDSLKNLEKRLEKHNILRCHRSFMVNMDHVQVVRRSKNGVYLEMGIENLPEIPASKSYSDKISKWFMKFS